MSELIIVSWAIFVVAIRGYGRPASWEEIEKAEEGGYLFPQLYPRGDN